MKHLVPGWTHKVLCLLALGSGLAVQASETVDVGLQAGVNLPTQAALRLTTGQGLNPAIGAHIDWRYMADHTLRFRADYGTFSEGKQTSPGPILAQDLRTKVKDASLGAEALYQPRAMNPPWHLGVGLYVIRWTVASKEILSVSGGTVSASSTSSWIRGGLGLVGTYRINPHLETELRFIASRYGYENQPVQVASLNLLWHF